MGSRSKHGPRRGSAQYLTPPPPDHQAVKREALDYIDDHPQSDADEVAQACFDGSRVIAHQALNSLRNDGFVTRLYRQGKNLYTTKER